MEEYNMSGTEGTAATYIAELVARARKAQAAIEFASQETVDKVAEAICWRAVQPAFARELAELAVAESRVGDVESQ